MLLRKDFQTNKEVKELIEDSISSCHFYSFDLEMSGIELDLESSPSEYDFPQLRYQKMRSVVKEYDAIQIGISFFIPKLKIDNKESQVYIERTFVAYLFRSSPFKYLSELYSTEECFSFFNDTLKASPESLKFLNENKFDFNAWLSQSHHYNKLRKQDYMKHLFKYHLDNGELPGHVLSFTNKCKEEIIEVVHQVIKNLTITYEKGHSQAKQMIIDTNDEFISHFVITLNLSSFLKIKNVTIIKNKNGKSSEIIVQRSKLKLDLDEFFKTFSITSDQDIKTNVTFDKLHDYKYKKHLGIRSKLQGDSLEHSESLIQEMIIEELGLSQLILSLINSNKPVVGHNMFYDLMFVYDKFYDDLPPTLEEYMKSLVVIFPQFIDTKILSTSTGMFDKTGLKNLVATSEKLKLPSLVEIISDVKNNFSLYEFSNELHHDAGFDARLTGRSFIYILKGIENKFETKDLNKCKKGHIDLELLNGLYLNQLVFNNLGKSYPFNLFTFRQSTDELRSQEENVVQIYKNTVLILKLTKKNLIIFEIKSILSSENFVFKLMILGSDVVAVELLNSNDIAQAKKEFQSLNQVKIVFDYSEFYQNSKEILQIP